MDSPLDFGHKYWSRIRYAPYTAITRAPLSLSGGLGQWRPAGGKPLYVCRQWLRLITTLPVCLYVNPIYIHVNDPPWECLDVLDYRQEDAPACVTHSCVTFPPHRSNYLIYVEHICNSAYLLYCEELYWEIYFSRPFPSTSNVECLRKSQIERDFFLSSAAHTHTHTIRY